jgi:hypothetical protein
VTTVVWTNLSSIVYGNISCITSAAKKQLPKIEPMKYMDHQSEFGSGKNGNKTGRGVQGKGSFLEISYHTLTYHFTKD